MTIYADLYRYRELFANLWRRDLRAKYKGSVLGLAWSLANPALLMGVYLFVFSVLWANDSIPYYPLYLLAGLALWVFFSTSLQTASRSMLDSAELIKKIRFPRQLVPLSLVATQLVTFAVMLGVLIVADAIVIPATRDTVWIALPVALLVVCFTAGIALVLASLNVLFRDVEHLLAAALLPWFFLTPILWRTEQVPETIRSHGALMTALDWVNPVAPVVRTLREPLWAGHAPAAGDLAYTAVAAVVALLASARSSSAASTTGSRSSCDADAAVVEPRLPGGRAQRREGPRPSVSSGSTPLTTDGHSSGCGKPGTRPPPGFHGASAARARRPERRPASTSTEPPTTACPSWCASSTPPRPVGRGHDPGREVGDGLGLLERDERLLLRVERARVGALDREPPLDPRRDVDLAAGGLAAELREPGAELGDEVDREAVAARRQRPAHGELEPRALAGLHRPLERRPDPVPDDRVPAQRRASGRRPGRPPRRASARRRCRRSRPRRPPGRARRRERPSSVQAWKRTASGPFGTAAHGGASLGRA